LGATLDLNNLYSLNITSVFLGPHINPRFLVGAVRYYPNAGDEKQKIIADNQNRIIIYQWVNLITGQTYIGSASNGSIRLGGYWRKSVLSKGLSIYKNILMYGYNNFAIAILEDLGATGSVDKSGILNREQYYLDILFHSDNLILNRAPIAGSNLGLKHSAEFIANRTGELNPMFNVEKSPEFISMQKRDKHGSNNPMFGKSKSAKTLTKLNKLVYVYKESDKTLVGVYPTVRCAKTFGMGTDTLYKYLANGLPFKGLIFSKDKLN
jgi:group I intron endonuclease